jgi:hypothetical protein
MTFGLKELPSSVTRATTVSDMFCRTLQKYIKRPLK